MKQYFKLDLDTMIETIIYITNWLSVFKCNQHEYIYIVMYLSDKLHLEKYGRFIYGESYQKLIHGPIPVALNKYVSNFIIPLREPNLKFLSESDIICLDETIIKSKILVEKHRATLMSIFRMPVNAYVIITLLALKYMDAFTVNIFYF